MLATSAFSLEPHRRMLDWDPEYHSPAPCTLRSRLLHPLATKLTDTGSTRQTFWQLWNKETLLFVLLNFDA